MSISSKNSGDGNKIPKGQGENDVAKRMVAVTFGRENRRASTRIATVATMMALFMTCPQNVESFELRRNPACRRNAPATRTNSLPRLLASLDPSGERAPVSLSSGAPTTRSSSSNIQRQIQDLLLAIQIATISLGVSLLLISWEDISMPHPMRQQQQETTTRWGQSTVRGMAFGERQRLALSRDLEAQDYQGLPSYNEVMLRHRTERVSQYETLKQNDITKNDIMDSVKNIQQALLQLQDCKQLTKDYEWDQLEVILNGGTFRKDLDSACYLLQRADAFLSPEAREVIGFDWGSCAWRHCGALADAQEAMDEIQHLLGVLEPFECLFCLDIVERSLRDMLDVIPTNYQNVELQRQIPAYTPLQRMSDVNEDDLDGYEVDFLDTLNALKNAVLN